MPVTVAPIDSEKFDHDWKWQNDVITDRDGNRPIDNSGYECQKCGEMRAQIQTCPHDEGDRLQAWSEDGEGYYIWRCAAFGS